MRLTRASKMLSYCLQHCTEPLYIDLDGGWADVGTMMQVLGVTRRELDEIVSSDAKGRYSYDDTGMRIRANQGHSIPGLELNMDCPEPPEFLYQGTATRFLDTILQEGLKPMSRQWVHISPDFETAVKVGMRHGKPAVLLIQARRFFADGNALFRSANGVWQAKAVAPEYFTVQYLAED